MGLPLVLFKNNKKNKKGLIPLRCPSFSVLVLCAGLLEEESRINNFSEE